MRIASWNVNSLTARLPRVTAWLEREQPDVLLLQETKCGDDSFPATAFTDLGYHSAHHGTGRWNGVAVLSRTELTDVHRGVHVEYDDVLEPRLIAATTSGVRVVSCYVPNGRTVGHPHFHYKLEWLQALRDKVADELTAHADLLVGGDFNIAPTDADVFDRIAFVGSTHVTPEERAALSSLLELGLVDLARHHQPEGTFFTYWDYRQGFFRRGMGMRIDLLLGTPSLRDRVDKVWVDVAERRGTSADVAKPSDHAPLLVDLA